MTDQDKERVFCELLKASWDKHAELTRHKRMDDGLLGAVVASCVKDGHLLLDLSSDGVNHFVLFENPSDRSRLIFRLRHLAEDVAVAKVMGHLADVVIGYGEKTPNLGPTWAALKSSIQNPQVLEEDEPGLITFDVDLTGGYLYAQVALLLDIGNYLSGAGVDVTLIRSHIDSTVHVLRSYMQGRRALVPAGGAA